MVGALVMRRLVSWRCTHLDGPGSSGGKLPKMARFTGSRPTERREAPHHTLVPPLHECCKGRVLELGRSVEPWK
jgi:hypothetical protein